MDLAAVQDFFNNPDKWQNFEYLTSGGASSVFAANIKGFVRMKKVVTDRSCNIQPYNFYLTYDYQKQPCTPYYKEAANMYLPSTFQIVGDTVTPGFRQINQMNALDKDGNRMAIGSYVELIDTEPMYDANGELIPVEQPSLGTLELDTTLNVVRWEDKTSGLIHEIALDQIAMIAIKPIKDNPLYPGQGVIY